MVLSTPEGSHAPSHSDVRAYAMNVATREILESVRSWPDPEHATAVLQMQVHGDQGQGIIVSHRAAAVATALARRSGIGHGGDRGGQIAQPIGAELLHRIAALVVGQTETGGGAGIAIGGQGMVGAAGIITDRLYVLGDST